MAADDIDLEVIAPTFPPGYCPQTNQQLANDIAAGLRVILPGEFAFWIVGPDEPTVEQRDFAWLRTDSISGVWTNIFTWSPLYGAWLEPHPVSPSGSARQLWVGTQTDLETYDGGEAGTVSATTGPFWSADAAFADKWPLGVGAGPALLPATNYTVFDVGTPAAPDARGVFFIQRTARIYRRSA
jgi:hypothetical protein